MKSEEPSYIIEYSHPIELGCGYLHIDYIEQFLFGSNTHPPCLRKFYVRCEKLVTITENFTRDATRNTCAQVNQIIFYEKAAMAHSKVFYIYFPSV